MKYAVAGISTLPGCGTSFFSGAICRCCCCCCLSAIDGPIRTWSSELKRCRVDMHARGLWKANRRTTITRMVGTSEFNMGFTNVYSIYLVCTREKKKIEYDNVTLMNRRRNILWKETNVQSNRSRLPDQFGDWVTCISFSLCVSCWYQNVARLNVNDGWSWKYEENNNNEKKNKVNLWLMCQKIWRKL